MTHGSPEDQPGGQDAWNAALGEANDPANPRFTGAFPYAHHTRYWMRPARNIALTLLVIGAVATGIVLVTRSSPTKDAGAPVGTVSISTPPSVTPTQGSTAGA